MKALYSVFTLPLLPLLSLASSEAPRCKEYSRPMKGNGLQDWSFVLYPERDCAGKEKRYEGKGSLKCTNLPAGVRTVSHQMASWNPLCVPYLFPEPDCLAFSAIQKPNMETKLEGHTVDGVKNTQITMYSYGNAPWEMSQRAGFWVVNSFYVEGEYKTGKATKKLGLKVGEKPLPNRKGKRDGTGGQAYGLLQFRSLRVICNKKTQYTAFEQGSVYGTPYSEAMK